MKLLWIVLIITVHAITIARAMKCYECNGNKTTPCFDTPDWESKSLIDCPEGKMCGIMESQDTPLGLSKRECVSADYCSDTKPNYTSCCTCEKDACNYENVCGLRSGAFVMTLNVIGFMLFAMVMMLI